MILVRNPWDVAVRPVCFSMKCPRNMLRNNSLHEEYKNLFCVPYTWNPKKAVWRPRKNLYMIGRIRPIHMKSGEAYYLYTLVNGYVRNPTSFDVFYQYKGKTYAYRILKTCCKMRNILLRFISHRQHCERHVKLVVYCKVSSIGKAC